MTCGRDNGESRMIELNEDFSFERDHYGWKLHHWVDGEDKDGNPKRHRHTTYYANLRNLSVAVVDRMVGGCGSMEELTSLLSQAEDVVTKIAQTKVGIQRT